MVGADRSTELLGLHIIFFKWAIPGLFFFIFDIKYSKQMININFADDWIQTADLCGQSYKHFTLVNYDSRVVPDLKIPHITTLES